MDDGFQVEKRTVEQLVVLRAPSFNDRVVAANGHVQAAPEQVHTAHVVAVQQRGVPSHSVQLVRPQQVEVERLHKRLLGLLGALALIAHPLSLNLQLLPGIGLNPTRAGLYQTLVDMGADIAFLNRREEGGESAADLRVRFAPLQGIEVPPERAASMIDEYPILAALAATAEGSTVMRGIRELRVKESDRIDAMARGLEACGVVVEEGPDWMIVHGRGPGSLAGGVTVASRLDHRIAMSFLCLGLAARTPILVDDASPIVTSFPDFVPLMRGLGADLTEPA